MRRIVLSGMLLVLASVFLFVIAKFHFVYGSEVEGIQVEPKPSLSLSETLINMDALGGMPMIAARAQYPMYVARMERLLEQLEFQNARGCHHLQVGMRTVDIEPKCGRPDDVSGSDMRWDTGLWVKVSNGVITEIKRR